jgi:hypothetical protein
MGLFSQPIFGNGGLFGGGGPAGQEDPQADARLAMMAQLLQGGGYSPQRSSFGEIMGKALMAGQAARQQSIQSQRAREAADLEKKYRQAQIDQFEVDKRKPVAVIGPDGRPMLVKPEDAIGKQPYSMNGAEPPASLQELASINADRTKQGLKPYTIEEWKRLVAQMTPINPTVGLVGGGMSVVQPTRAGQVNVTPLSTADQENAAAGEKSGAQATGTGQANRVQAQIDLGLSAADSMATVKRARQLLETVDTGGLDNLKLKATQLFGVTGADETELSANIGKAVLSQLRQTFGAQFTAAEGERLAGIEAGFGKSTEGNKRLLEQAEKILDRAARRGLSAAERSGDTFSVEEIKKSLSTDLTPGKDKELTYDPATGTFK